MDYCRICGLNSHGSHFGVPSCRACAAFFRRSANSKWNGLGCQSKLCDDQNYHCKPCRVKKCWSVGMDPTRFQTDDQGRSLINRKRTLPPSFEYLVGRPHLVLFTDTENIDNPDKFKTYVDFSKVIEKVEKILERGPATPFIAENSLKKLGFGLRDLKLMAKKPREIELVTRSDTTSFWEWYLLTVSKWLVHFDKFHELSTDLKAISDIFFQLKILFSVWHVWGRFYKLMATALYQKNNKMAKTTERIVGNGLLTDYSKVKSESEWLSDYSQEQVNYFLAGIRNNEIFPLSNELNELNISDVELNFMLAQLSFQYVTDRHRGKNEQISETMEEFMEVLTDNLHDYYVNQRKMPTYSGRLMQMLRVNSKIQENIRKNRPRVEMAKIFKIFKLEFSHPEIFEDTGYG